MPELPELEVVKEVLRRRVVGQSITAVEVVAGGALVVRDLTGAGLEPTCTGATIENVDRRGKFLAFSVRPRDHSFLYLVLNPKLTGRLQLVRPNEKRFAKTHVVFSLSSEDELRYVDQRQMGQLYLTRTLDAVPEYARLGPEPFEISGEEFRSLLQHFHGEIKGILTRGEFVAGIGNAYADEILWAARIYPYRKRTQLTLEETDHLYRAMQAT
ncbi:MAG: DNA-formamidopyrimidine glycosylase family protein, partial [Acidobacteriota bacterium]